MAILLTGGSGFIGSHFHNALPPETIVNLDLNSPFFPTSAKFIQGDIRKPEDVRLAMKSNKIDRIISLAAKHHDFGIGHDEYFDTNEDGTRVICGLASEFGIKEIVFYSSVAVYGLSENISTESSAPQPDSPYGASKLAGEKVLVEWAQEQSDRRVIIMRPTIVFGENNKANMFNLINQINSGFFFHIGKADNIKSIAYVENLVAATLFLMETQQQRGVQIYNYADEPQLTTKEISVIIAQKLRKKIRFTIPKSLAIAFGWPFDIVIRVTGKNLPISSNRIKKLATSTQHSARKLFGLGFSPRFSTKEGLVKMISWYQSLQQK